MNVTFDRPGWSYEILKALHVFQHQEEYCDVVVVCNDKKIRAHSCVLAAASPWVASELQCGSSEGPVQIVSLEDTPSQVVQYIMTFVYTGQFKVPLKHIKEAQSLASRLGIRCLKDRDEDDDGSGDEGSHGDHGNHGDSPMRDIPARDTPVRARGAGRRASDLEHRVPDSSLPSDTVVTLNRDWSEADSTPSASQSDSTPTVSQSTSLTLPSSSTPDPGVPAPSLSHLSGTPLPGTSRNSRLKRVAQDHEDIKPDTPPKRIAPMPTSGPTITLVPLQRMPITSVLLCGPAIAPVSLQGIPTSTRAATKPVPNSTLFYRRRRAEEEKAGKVKRPYTRRALHQTCKKCAQPRLASTHRQYYGHWYCICTATIGYHQWLRDLKARGYGARHTENKIKTEQL